MFHLYNYYLLGEWGRLEWDTDMMISPRKQNYADLGVIPGWVSKDNST